MSEFSEYIVYVDESGDHGLSRVDPEYPVFVLAFCVFQKVDYSRLAVPQLQQLKFTYFGHDNVVLHGREIRKRRGDFSILLRPDTREAFMRDLNALIASLPFTLVASCIRKRDFVEQRGDSFNPYHVALETGLEQVFAFLCERGQRHALTHVVFESRGRREDQELEKEFERISASSKTEGLGAALRMVMASKKSNTCGLQLADLAAHPIGRHVLDPRQDNRAYALLRAKLRRGPDGEIAGQGLISSP